MKDKTKIRQMENLSESQVRIMDLAGTLDESLRDALVYAKEKHAGQVRKFDGKPYVSHPFRVMRILNRFKSNSKNIDALRKAAVLHDTLEDTDATQEEIESKFGRMVASIVHELTSDAKAIRKVGKKEYLTNKMIHDLTDYALVLKLADRLDNVMDMSRASLKFRDKYGDETRFIIDNLKEKRKLTNTQKRILDEIEKVISSFGY